MGFIWDVVKGFTKIAVNVHTLGAFDTPVFEDDESHLRAQDCLVAVLVLIVIAVVVALF